MQTVILVFLGSGIGGVSRFFIYQMMNYWHYSTWFGTIICNLLGSFLISFLVGCFSLNTETEMSKNLNYLFITGFLGGFTTFSAFSFDSIKLFNDNINITIIYVIVNVIGGIVFCGAGFLLSRFIFLR